MGHKVYNCCYLSLLLLLLLTSCAIRDIEKSPSFASERSHVLTVFMDGTNNKANKLPEQNTHVKTLHSLALDSVHSYYVEGVGTRGKVLGGLLGVGTKARVTRAYRFLASRYNAGDSIFLFGFSRGANQCRILSNLIYTAGVIDLNKVNSKGDKKKIVRNVYRKYRMKDADVHKRRTRIAAYLEKWNRRYSNDRVTIDTTGNVRIEAMGLFETVEAFNIFDGKEVTAVRKDHLNQAMNSNKILHAVALDDNRAITYTPVLLTTNDVMVDTAADKKGVVEEVWFNGSHRDVGGAHRTDPYLQNISLNWMRGEMWHYKIFRDTTLIEYTYQPAHNMNGTILQKIIFADNNRSVPRYYNSFRTTYNNRRIKIHSSVIERLRVGVVPHFKRTNARKDWFDLPPFKDCFTRNGWKRIFKKECKCIEEVTTLAR